MNLTIDPNGLWRRKRFEFCNALEAAISARDSASNTDLIAKAWEELEKLGVKRVDEAVKTEESRDFRA